MIQKLSVLAALAAITTNSLTSAQAFDGAVGWGAVATGGNSGTEYHVTNLNDSGTGSFRDAVSEGNRYVVFDVSGYIVLETPVSLSSDLTIDGTTAPGDGIGIMAREVSASSKDNIIIRNIRLRQGTDETDSKKSAFNMGDGSNIILDHVSIAYGVYDSIDAVGAVNITISNSIIALPIGQQFGAHVETGPATYYGNLWVSAHNRQPLSKANSQYINNVVYNYQAAYTVANTGGVFSHDIINNYFITGPSTSSASDAFYQMDAGQTVYVSGNYLDDNDDGTLNGDETSSVGSATIVTTPNFDNSESMATYSAADAYTYVIANVGASPRDEVDTYIIGTVESLGTEGAIIKDQDDTGLSNDGYGTLTETTASTDSKC